VPKLTSTQIVSFVFPIIISYNPEAFGPGGLPVTNNVPSVLFPGVVNTLLSPKIIIGHDKLGPKLTLGFGRVNSPTC